VFFAENSSGHPVTWDTPPTGWVKQSEAITTYVSVLTTSALADVDGSVTQSFTGDSKESTMGVILELAQTATAVSNSEVALWATVSSSTTALPLTTASWTQDPHAYPLAVTVRGEIILVASAYTDPATGLVVLDGCTRGVNNVAKSHPAGTTVTLADPFRLAL
jgi:hypothetical protein